MGGKQSGYTILEVMIFLSISLFLLTASAIAISGRQDYIQFTQAVRDLDSKLQDVINDVNTGYFPEYSGISCTTPGNAAPTLNAFGSTNQGGSDECVFVGKAVQFSPQEDESSINIFTIVGRRNRAGSTNIPVTTYAEAQGVAVAVTDANINNPDLTETLKLQGGIRIVDIVRRTPPYPKYGGLAFVTSFGQLLNGGSSYLTSGTSSTNFMPVFPSQLNQRKNNFAERINSLHTQNNAVAPVNPADGLVLCIENGDGSRQASIRIGGNNAGATTLVQFDDYDTGAC